MQLSNVLKPVNQINQNIVYADLGGPRYSIMTPRNNIPHALNSQVDIISKQSIEYYECRGVPIVQKANFVSASVDNSFLYFLF